MAVHELWNSVDRLSNIIVWANWGIALTLLMTFACTVITIKAGNRRDDLIRIQDLVKSQAIADTSERAGKLERDNLILRSQLATLEANAAHEKAEEQRTEIALAQSNIRLDAERRDRLQLQHSVLWRMIHQDTQGNKSTIDPLKPFKGAKVLVKSSTEPEPSNFVGVMATIFQNAGWQFVGFLKAEENKTPAGVTIMVHRAYDGAPDLPLAGKTLAKFLTDNEIAGARFQLVDADRDEFDSDTILLLIGQTP